MEINNVEINKSKDNKINTNGLTNDDKITSKQIIDKEKNHHENDITNSKEHVVDLECILQDFKMYGRYNIKCIFLVGLLVFVGSCQHINYIFAAEMVDYRCKYSNCNNTELSKLEFNTSLDLKCHKYNLFESNGTCSEENFDVSHSVYCDEWVYDNPDSLVAEFNLGCEDWKRTFIGTMHSIGYMLGLLLIGPLSDKFGRKSVIIYTTLAGVVIGVSKSVTYSYWLYIFLEMLEPLLGNNYSPAYTLAVEMVRKKYRPLITIIINVFTTLGDLLMAVIAWLSPNWRIFLISIYSPGFIFVLYIFWMDDSLRWLINKGKRAEFETIIRKAAKTNNITIDENKLSNIKCDESSRNISWWTLMKMSFTSKKLFLRLLSCVCMWFTALFNSYSFTINSVSLKGNKYLNYAFTTLAGIPSCLILWYLLTKYRRRKPLMFSFLLTATFCIGHSFIPTEYVWLSVLLYVGGKLAASISIRIVYIYTSELFPTYTRNTMHAMCSALGRMGAILAPQTPLLMAYWPCLPALIMGVLSVLTAAVVALMPDTSNDVLPDNIQQAEAVGQKTDNDVSSKL